MKRPYLIQRGHFRVHENKKGIDQILHFDYMGSAEFEFGTLPQSLIEIRKNISDYIYMDILLEYLDTEPTITVFCKREHESHIGEYLRSLYNSEFHLKERSEFREEADSLESLGSATNFWWDLDNNIMFWKKNEAYEQAFKREIKPK